MIEGSRFDPQISFSVIDVGTIIKMTPNFIKIIGSFSQMSVKGTNIPRELI